MVGAILSRLLVLILDPKEIFDAAVCFVYRNYARPDWLLVLPYKPAAARGTTRNVRYMRLRFISCFPRDLTAGLLSSSPQKVADWLL